MSMHTFCKLLNYLVTLAVVVVAVYVGGCVLVINGIIVVVDDI